MDTYQISIDPYQDQRAGTSGLRKKVTIFEKEHYIEQFIQATLNTVPVEHIIIGGDGRYYSPKALQRILQILIANRVKKISIAQHGLLSTPAMSFTIRASHADLGINLTASHNPGGATGDFGIKLNLKNGAPTQLAVTNAIYQASNHLTSYKTCDLAEINLESIREFEIFQTKITIFDGISNYLEALSNNFDFDLLKNAFKAKNLSLCFDAFHGVTGPYAQKLFCDILGAPPESVIHAIPRPDFGGLLPEPNPKTATTLLSLMRKKNAPIFGAASDGDGDRNFIVYPGGWVHAGDSLAIITHYADLIPQFKDGLTGVARSMPTSSAVDLVAKAQNIPCFVTPTGWKFFGSLLDANLIGLCGEESFSTGANHIREKDGLWAVLAWATIIAKTKKTVAAIIEDFWQKYGRIYHERRDFQSLPSYAAHALINAFIEERWANGPLAWQETKPFHYQDPVTNDTANKQGFEILFDGAKMTLRSSGTTTKGETVRVYLEANNKEKFQLLKALYLEPIALKYNHRY